MVQLMFIIIITFNVLTVLQEVQQAPRAFQVPGPARSGQESGRVRWLSPLQASSESGPMCQLQRCMRHLSACFAEPQAI